MFDGSPNQSGCEAATDVEQSTAGTLAEQLLEGIAADLEAWLESPDVPPGLMDGTAGVALFFSSYAARTGQDRHVDLAARALHRSLDAISDPDRGPSLGGSACAGLSGIAWCVDHLRRTGCLDLTDGADSADPVEALMADLDQALSDALVDGLMAGQMDPLHSTLGAVTFLTRSSATSRAGIQRRLEDAVELLSGHAIRDERGARWANSTRPGEFDLGFAHGASGTICFLARLVGAGVSVDLSSPLLEAAVRWLDSTRLPPASSPTALFPSSVTSTGDPTATHWSRLGWCYGDLGVAVALLAAGIALDRPTWNVRASDILHHAGRRTADEGEVADAGLCHGSMGIRQIYRRASEWTGSDGLRRISDRWYRHGLSLGGQAAGAAGFRARTPNGYRATRSLLQGTAGIGLTILEATNENGPTNQAPVPGWDEWLLPFPDKSIAKSTS